MATSNGERPLVDQLFRKNLGLDRDLVVDLLVYPGHAYENGRFNLRQGLRKLLDGRAIGQRHAVVQHREIHVPGSNMREGQKRDAPVSGANLEVQQRTGDVGSEIAMR